MTNIISMRLNKDQLERLQDVLLFWGVSNTTEVVQVALNHLENVLQGVLTINLIDAVASIKDNNKQLKKVKYALTNLKGNTKY